MITTFTPRPGLHLAVASIPAALNTLRSADISPASRTMPPWRAREHLAGRALARTLLSKSLGLPSHTPLRSRTGGPPCVPGHPRLSVSISHSGDTVAAAVAHQPVGIDIQAPSPPSEGLLRRCCSPSAAAALRRLPPEERALHFAYLWTAQEACVKALGTGLAGAPWRIDVAPGAREGRWRRLTWRHLTDIGSPLPTCLAYGRPVAEGEEGP
ncbi:4'-phosphopantetheinyl transferase superfamily protein [Streptomyces sp. NPDC006261]|uniref:4'-phosphopantetheinyl transferase family protein n=1 Tax=Streptomyces sp. NPDC006261 TaxID=3156739 RepID=UPI0033A488FF